MRKLNGYMTVEASFVVPIVVCSFIFIIYISNYMYARCILAQDSYILAFRAANELDEYGNPQAYIQEKSERIFAKKYFGNRKPKFTAKQQGKTVVVTGETETKHSFGRYFGLPENGWKLESIESAKNIEYAKHIRTIKRLKDIGLGE